jgi:sterol desaturase/sphingolipid hydroxylase (fatty acid hydroxylase superfamily)
LNFSTETQTLIEGLIDWFQVILTIDFARYLFGAGGVFLLTLLGRQWLATRKIRTKSPRRRQMMREFRASLITVFVFGVVGLSTKFGLEAGWMEIYGDIDDYGWGYFTFSLIAIIILHDAYFYWTHRLMHLKGMMKHIHWLHHRSHNPSPWASYSFDMPEAAVHALFVPLALLLLPMHGLAMWLFLGHMIIRNAMGHSGYELFPRRWAVHPLLGWLTLVTHHDMHHANGNYNFGLYFSWWDRLMGTEHPDYLARVTGDPDRCRAPLGVTGAKENA